MAQQLRSYHNLSMGRHDMAVMQDPKGQAAAPLAASIRRRERTTNAPGPRGELLGAKLPAPKCDGIVHGMKTTIDSAGRIVIPKAIREQAGLYAGVPIEIRVDDEGIVLTPERPAQQLERRGRYVAIVRQDAEPAVTGELVEAVRDEIWLERLRQAATGEEP